MGVRQSTLQSASELIETPMIYDLLKTGSTFDHLILRKSSLCKRNQSRGRWLIGRTAAPSELLRLALTLNSQHTQWDPAIPIVAPFCGGILWGRGFHKISRMWPVDQTVRHHDRTLFLNSIAQSWLFL